MSETAMDVVNDMRICADVASKKDLNGFYRAMMNGGCRYHIRWRAEVAARDAIASRIQSLFDREDEARNEALRLLDLVAHSPSTGERNGFLISVELWDEISAFVKRMRGE